MYLAGTVTSYGQRRYDGDGLSSAGMLATVCANFDND
jgi:hypothetical protein